MGSASRFLAGVLLSLRQDGGAGDTVCLHNDRRHLWRVGTRLGRAHRAAMLPEDRGGGGSPSPRPLPTKERKS